MDRSVERNAALPEAAAAARPPTAPDVPAAAAAADQEASAAGHGHDRLPLGSGAALDDEWADGLWDGAEARGDGSASSGDGPLGWVGPLPDRLDEIFGDDARP